MKAASPKQIKITLVRSLIGYPESQRKVARGLGLRKPNSSVVREDTPSIRGMVRKITHMLKVEGVE
ncbi:MAG: 50S ribosomal protein L30 [Candidatus Aminicenantes bacterium]|nr:50S ribosomal protein L30 [Candidatus Aminicenantes bacterium]